MPKLQPNDIRINDAERILPRLSGAIKELLDREIACGNQVMEVSENWPMKNVNIWLERHFHDHYVNEFPSLRYEFVGGPHDWVDHYLDAENGFFIAVAHNVRTKKRIE